jgi:beta-galactosidase
VPADVAIVLDWDNWWAFELDAHPHNGMTYPPRLEAHYWPLYDANIPVDVVPTTADLSGYRMVVVPNLYLMSTSTAESLERYVENGGELVVSFFSGIVDEQDRVHLGGYPAPLRRLLGLSVQEFAPLAGDATVPLSDPTGDLVGSATTWTEEVDLEGAEAVWQFADGELAGWPAVTRHRFGAGTAWYVATAPDEPTFRRLLDSVRTANGIEPLLPGTPTGVQVRALRSLDGTHYLVLLNHAPEPVTINLPQPMVDVVSGDQRSVLSMSARGVAVLSAP